MFLHGPDKTPTHFALGLRKHDLLILVGFAHLTDIWRLQDDPLCSAFGEEKETPLTSWGNDVPLC